MRLVRIADTKIPQGMHVIVVPDAERFVTSPTGERMMKAVEAKKKREKRNKTDQRTPGASDASA